MNHLPYITHAWDGKTLAQSRHYSDDAAGHRLAAFKYKPRWGDWSFDKYLNEEIVAFSMSSNDPRQVVHFVHTLENGQDPVEGYRFAMNAEWLPPDTYISALIITDASVHCIEVGPTGVSTILGGSLDLPAAAGYASCTTEQLLRIMSFPAEEAVSVAILDHPSEVRGFDITLLRVDIRQKIIAKAIAHDTEFVKMYRRNFDSVVDTFKRYLVKPIVPSGDAVPDTPDPVV